MENLITKNMDVLIVHVVIQVDQWSAVVYHPPPAVMMVSWCQSEGSPDYSLVLM